MASKQGLTAVHGSLIFFVLVSFILATVAYINYRDLKEASARADKATQDLSKEQTAHRTADQGIQDLKGKIGHAGPQIGAPESDGDGSVIGDLNADLKKFAPGDLSQGTVREVLKKLNEAIAQLTQERNGLNAEKDKRDATINALQKQYQEAVAAQEHAREGAEKDRDQAQRTKEETIQAKDTQIAELEERARTVTLELQQEKDASTKLAAELTGRISRLEQINDQLRKKQEEEEDLSFDQPDGYVEWVDHQSGAVWINLGESDNLKKRTSFSVYTKGNYGVGHRDKADIKGAIEVTRNLGPHQAEARIIENHVSDPIAPGDPIYTPLWGSGKNEHLATVGLLDLDNDGRSDRERFHEIVKGAGATIDVEVDDQGARIPAEGRLSVQTKFLIVGKIPDPTKSKPDEQAAHKQIGERHRELMSEAREQGIRVINLSDFLDFIGYKAKRRLWQPGVSPEWNLKKGSRSTGLSPSAIMGTESTGQTSGLYSRERRLAPRAAGGRYRPLAPQESTGQTTKALGGKK